MIEPEAHTASPSALRELYTELRQLVTQGLNQPYDLAIAERVEHLVTGPLAALKRDLLARQTARLPEWVATLVELGQDLEIADFEDTAFVAAFRHAWGSYFDRRLRHPVEIGFFEDVRAGLAAHGEEARIALAEPRHEYRETARRLAELEARLGSADFKQRRGIGQELAQLHYQLGAIEQRIAAHEMQALSALLPPDVAYDNLPTQPPALTFTPETYHPTALAALLFEPGAEPTPGIEADLVPEPAPVNVPEPALACEQIATASELLSPADFPALDIREPDEGATPPDWLMHWLQPESPADAPPEDAAVSEDSPGLDVPTAPEPVFEEDAEEAEDLAPLPAEDDDVPQDYSADADTAVQRFHAAYEQAAPAALATAIENIAFHWIDRGYVNVAYTTLYSARISPLPVASLLEPDLFKAAYFGLHVWSGEAENLAAAREALDVLPLERLDAWCERQPGGGAVPYLLLVAALQPALFGGEATAAPQVLERIAPKLEPVAREIVRELLAPNRPVITLDSLRRPQGGKASASRTKLASRLRDWHDRVLHKQTGWEPVRLALGACLAHPEFKRALTAIATGSDDAEGVSALVEQYRDRNAIAALLEAQLAAMPEADPVDHHAKSWFTLNLIELCGIADDWLAEYQAHPPAEGAPSLVERLARLRTELETAARTAPDFESRVGAKLAVRGLGNLRRAIADPQSGVVWSAKQTFAFLSLPYDMMRAVGFSGDAEGELVWLVDRLCSVPEAE